MPSVARPGPSGSAFGTSKRLRFIVSLTASLVLGAAALPGAGCTISRPRGETHLRTMASGDRHFGHGRLDEAADSYAEAAESAERRVDRDEASYRQARVYMRQDKWEEAVELLDEIAARRPVSRRTPRALFDASVIRLDHLGETARAMEGFEEVMRSYPDRGNGARALFFRLKPFRDSDDPEGAVAYLEALYPEVADTSLGDDVLRHQATILRREGDRERAKALLWRIIRDHPHPQGHRWDDAILTLAEMELEDGDPEEAIEHLRMLVEQDDTTTLTGSYTLPTMSQAQMQIAHIYRDQLEDYEAADREYRFFVEHFHRNLERDDAEYERGAMWIDVGEVERGCDILRGVVEDYEVGHARREAIARLRSECDEESPEDEESDG